MSCAGSIDDRGRRGHIAGMIDDPRDSMRVIDAALARLPADVTDIRILLAWPRYRDLMAIKGLATDPHQRKTWGKDYELRPLKTYRGHALILNDHNSQVLGTQPDGSTTGWAIAN